MKSRSRDGLPVKGLLKFKHKNCFQNNTLEKKKRNTLFAGEIIHRVWSRVRVRVEDRVRLMLSASVCSLGFRALTSEGIQCINFLI